MNSFYLEYLPIAIFIFIACGLSVLFAFSSWIVGEQNPDDEKLSPYECGFEPFEDARVKFDVRFYLIAILFIIFDLEIAFLFPWSVALSDIGLYGFISMMVFLFLLIVGFVYEWKKGALEWE
ncbi:MAG: NAD(P)H-quinone oxidoreductase subunit 3 [Alphaproteobacteria bacterium MarineAlpha9_Bin2]|mgnify:FL=1|jgi:NADH-quinone oxidoreductase subunit A|nr:MAG: NAD(P)H-quinone oxidoreductase subunit 3 [Alphaproteobacteria bacterium MarineAlpha9_Bin2]